MEINEIIETLINLKQVQKEYCAKHYIAKAAPQMVNCVMSLVILRNLLMDWRRKMMAQANETKVFQWTNHKALRYWLSAHPRKYKDSWPQWKINGGTVETVKDHCFACAYGSGCDECPWEFDDNGRCLGGLYRSWHSYGNNDEEDADIARTIAVLPVKEGIICV